MLGKWDSWYQKAKQMGSFRYGNTPSYGLAAEFLKDLEVEDWGCGTGGFKRVYQGPKYIGVDGSETPFVDKLVDLRTYKSSVDGIMMRHVLEHNYDWKDVLANAVASFNKRFCLIIFTPFVEETQEIAHNASHGVDVPDMAFSKHDIEQFFKGLRWHRAQIKSNTHYGVEQIYFVEK